jgi:uncharacterized protein (TIGR02466 family)
MNSQIKSIEMFDLFSIGLGIYQRKENFSAEEFNCVKEETYTNNELNKIGTNFKFLHSYKELNKIKNFCQESLNHYFNEILNKKEELEISISWANKTNPGMAHHTHNHRNSVISGVFYFNDTIESPITFTNPMGIFDAYDTSVKINHNKYNMEKSTIRSKTENYCILFPSFLPHNVEQNLSNEARYSIAFNSFFKPNQEIGSGATLLQL